MKQTTFENITFDDKSRNVHQEFKVTFIAMTNYAEKEIKSKCALFFFKQHMEEAFYWMGVGVKEDQLAREELKNLNGI